MNLPPSGLHLPGCWMNSAGSMGFAPDGRIHFPEPMAAFITHPISRLPRSPAERRICLPFAGGFLLHTGLPNPGLRVILKQMGTRWARAGMPIWVHLLAESPTQLAEMTRELEDQEGVEALEISIPPHFTPSQALELASAGLGELPLVIHIPITRAGESWLDRLPEMGISAISLGAPRGTLPLPDGGQVTGRLYGPALFPLTLAAVKASVGLKLPVIAGAGIFGREQAEALLKAGAAAVQLDAVLWRGWFEN